MLFNLRKYFDLPCKSRKWHTSIAQISCQHSTLSSESIRREFLDYFINQHNHRFVRSSPVVPYCDPTVPFVNAGMNQFRNVFLGRASAPSKRVANSQKCIRISGKHNDLNVIGTDGYHHTFFEMLGNWSFGDYFKETACKLAWNLLTGPYMIDPSRLYVTYFGGSNELGLQPDHEVKEIWKSLGVRSDRILPFGSKDNFWEMGLTGPCGPCTEIHIDHLPNSRTSNRAQDVNAGLADLTELWNIVFIQYMRNDDGTLKALPHQYVDTGMGFERLVAILQEKSSNYDTDLFTPIFSAISKAANTPTYQGVFDQLDSRYELDYAYRVIADHARMCAICIADGMSPGHNNKFQRILHKAIHVADNVFKRPNLLEAEIIPQIVEILSGTYPELEKNENKIRELILFERERIKLTSENALRSFGKLRLRKNTLLTETDVVENPNLSRAFQDINAQMKANPDLKTLSGADMMRLYIFFGLNEDIIEKLAHEKGLTVDKGEFARLKQEHKEEMKQKRAVGISSEEFGALPKTDDSFKYQYEFDKTRKQYRITDIQSEILGILPDKEIAGLYHVVVNQTNFYYTAGGQDCDIGRMTACNDKKSVFNVETVEWSNDRIIHSGRFEDEAASFVVGDIVKLSVDSQRRTRLTQHHTATHLLQAAIKQVTNKTIYQNSSHVCSEYLRFSGGIIGNRLTNEEIINVENLIRQLIKSAITIDVKSMSESEFYAADDITTVPGVTYPDSNIRVLQIRDETINFLSLEPCCGTHVRNTSELQDFCILAHRDLRSGIHEFIAVSGDQAEKICSNEKSFLNDLAEIRERLRNSKIDEGELRALFTRVKRMKTKLKDNFIPYVSKITCIDELEKFDKRITVTLGQMKSQKPEVNDDDSVRRSDRNSALTDLENNLQEGYNKPFIIHVIHSDRPLQFKLIRKATTMGQNKPIVIINVSEGEIVGARASIPIEFTNKHFNAQSCIEIIARATGYGLQIQETLLNDCSVSDLKNLQDLRSKSGPINDVVQELEQLLEKICVKQEQEQN